MFYLTDFMSIILISVMIATLSYKCFQYLVAVFLSEVYCSLNSVVSKLVVTSSHFPSDQSFAVVQHINL